MSDERTLLASRIILKAMLPVLKVLVEDDPKIKKKFEGVNARFQIEAANNGTNMGACLVFKDGALEIEQGISDSADITFSFDSPEKMNAMFGGKIVVPKIKGIWKINLLRKFASLLLGMKVMMPNVSPNDPEKKRLKVKMSFYMITTALSQYNKGGDPEMASWTSKQPERIYQISVDQDIAAYLRLKAGKSKAGRGMYKKRRPFVHLKFNGVDGAYPIVMNEVDMVAAMKKGYLTIEGSPEYGRDFGDFMNKIQDLIM